MTAKITEEYTLHEFSSFGPATLEYPLERKEFIDLSNRFPELRMEREANGKVTVMSPVKRGTGRRELDIGFFVKRWQYETGKGEVYGPSIGIEFPDGRIKSLDCAWVSDERLSELPKNSDEDFVVEVRSSTDSLKKLKEKMELSWMANGVQLVWLIAPYKEKVWIYREGQEVEVVEGFSKHILTGKEVMPGMKLPLTEMKAKK